MISTKNLIDRYQQLVDETPSPSDYNEAGEWISTLYEDEWIRIYFIRRRKKPEATELEVELSLPKSSLNPSRKLSKLKTRKVLQNTIKYLDYLIRLQDAGFTIEIMASECLWTAEKSFSKQINQQLFETILPP